MDRSLKKKFRTFMKSMRALSIPFAMKTSEKGPGSVMRASH
jgi:hypothetical protein